MLIHKMRLDDNMAVLDVNSGAVHLVDDVIYDLLDYYEENLHLCSKHVEYNDILEQYNNCSCEETKDLINKLRSLE